MPKLLKGQAQPVAQSFIGSALLEVVSRGGPTVITWFFAHQAAIRGWALPWIIIMAAFVFLAFSLAFHYIFRVRKTSPESEQLTPTDQKLSLPSESVSPNLVSSDARIVLVGQDSDDTLYQCEFAQEVVIGGAAVAFIKNEVNDQPIGRADSVRAHITFSEITGPRKTEINNALWLGSRHRKKTFEVGDSERLIIAVKPIPKGEVYAVESNYVTRAGERVYSPLYPELLGKIYIVTVRLVGGEHGEINHTFKYRLETKPDLYIEKIDESETVSEIGILNKELTDARQDAEESKEKLHGLERTNDDLSRTIEQITRERDHLKNIGETQKQSLEISRREVAEARREADAQTRTYELTFEGMKADLAHEKECHELDVQTIGMEKNKFKEDWENAKRTLENARKEINFETSQRDQWMKQCDEAKTRLAELWWLRERAVVHADHIEEYVIIKRIQAHRLSLDKKQKISVVLEIENGSIFDVTILTKQIQGHFLFDDDQLETNVRASQPEERILIGSYQPLNNPPTLLVIEQPLRGFEADRIREADRETKFWLGNIGIWVCVDDKAQSQPAVTRKKLIIPPDYDSVYLKDFEEKK